MEKDNIYDELKKEVLKANQRIAKVEKRFGEGTWGLKKIEAQLNIKSLNAWTDRGRIRITREMDIKTLKIIKNYVDRFLNNPMTSTLRGIKKRIQKTKTGIGENIGVSEQEAELLYSYFDDDNFKYLNHFIPDPSDVFRLIEEAKERNFGKQDFKDAVKSIIEFSNDSELATRLDRIYEKMIKKG